MPSTRLLPPLLRVTRSAPSTARFSSLLPRATAARRTLTTTTARLATKETQDKDSLKPVSSEYSKSGGDDAAAHSDAAFDPSTTKPEEQHAQSGGGGDGASGNPLQVSPGNPEVSKPRGGEEGGAERSQSESQGERKRSSGAGSGPKAGGAKSG